MGRIIRHTCREAALHVLRRHPAPGFSDGLVVELARVAGHLPLWTFDGALGRIDGATTL